MGAMVGASGPIDQQFFNEVLREMTARLRAVMPVDGVFLSLHGAAIGTVDRAHSLLSRLEPAALRADKFNACGL